MPTDSYSQYIDWLHIEEKPFKAFAEREWKLVQPGVEATKIYSTISLLGKFSVLQHYLLDALNHIHIWQVSPQLLCWDTCQTWIWYSIGV